jgi:transposase
MQLRGGSISIPNVGPFLIGGSNPFRFQNGKQVLKMAGLDLNAERSGKNSESAVPVISKRGKADLRYALYQAAFIASIRNQDFIVYYTNQLRGREREPGIKTKMRVKLAAKLLIIAWTLMKKKEPFHPSHVRVEFQPFSAGGGREQ